MSEDNFTRKIENYVKKMPSLPVSVGKVMELCNNVAVNPQDLNQVISLDPVLTGRLLQLINSAYYGMSDKVRSLVKAIIMLGINTVKNLTLSTAILSTLSRSKEIEGLNMDGFWRHCLCVGVTSKLLAAKQGVDAKFHQEYFTAGLLHDIGKIPLNAVLGAEYLNAIIAADREHRPLFVGETEQLGINHCDAGDLIARSWSLYGPVAEAIACHHNPKEYAGENSQLINTVAIADYFSLVYEVGFAGNRKLVKPDCDWKSMGLSDDTFEEIKNKVFSEIENAKVFLNLS
ncbi:MAG: HDOD domain-containing protein [Treponema sp.]|jgi:HD-like signal output (HDOD) protein|nr:HDOD domain-containing protein [Treponema sp.]